MKTTPGYHALLIGDALEHGYYKQLARYRWVQEREGELIDRLRRYDPECWGNECYRWDGLRLDCQAHQDKDGRWSELYGMQVEFLDVYSIQLETAEAMVRQLRAVHRGLDRIRNVRGDLVPGDFGGFVMRVAEVLKITRFLRFRNPRRHNEELVVEIDACEVPSTLRWLYSQQQPQDEKAAS